MPYKRIIAFGDSFTRGDELADCPAVSDEHPLAHSNHTWPAMIAKTLRIEYDCRATGGRGNQYISNLVNRRIEFEKPCLFIVNWTYFGRFDFIDHNDRWSTICPGSEDEIGRNYYKNFDNDIWNLHRNLQIIHSVLSLLEANKIDFIFTCHDLAFKATIDTLRHDCPSAARDHWHKSIQILSKLIVPKIIEFEGLTFTDWAIKYSYPIGPGGHPLEKAHAEAAKYINTIITKESQNEY